MPDAVAEPVEPNPNPTPASMPATTTPPAAVEVEPEAPKVHELYPDDHPLVKTLAAQKEQIKDLKAAKTRLDEIEAQKARDEQTWRERAEAAEARNAERDKQDARNALARDVVKGTGFSASLLDGLTTEDAMRARVEELRALKGPEPVAPAAPPASIVGNADPKPANQVAQLTAADLKSMSPAQIREADKNGQLDELKGTRK